MNSTEAVYSACQRCTAKWFGASEVGSCPRCGASQVLRTFATPPWRGPRTKRLDVEPDEMDARNYHRGRSTLPRRICQESAMKLIDR